MRIRPHLCALFALALTSSFGCSSPEKVAQPAPTPDPFASTTAYGQHCQALSAARAKDHQDKRYVPAELMLHRWPTAPATPPAAADGKTPAAGKAEAPPVAAGPLYRLIGEERFVELLGTGQSRVALLIARGGTGKSKLAWSIEAQMCGQQPVFRIDLQWDVAERLSEVPEGGNAVLHHLAGRLGLPTGAAGEAALKAALKGKRAIVLLDSLDEVALRARPKIVASVNDALQRLDNLSALVLTRPPVYTGNYGLNLIDAMVELPMLGCDRTDMVRSQFIQDAEERRLFDAFVARYALDRKVQGAQGRCYFPHMATFRDFFVVKSLAATHTRKGTSPELPPTFETSRAKLYEFYLRISIVKDMQGVNIKAGDVLKLVDDMLEAANPSAGARNVSFDVKSCLAAMPKEMGEDERHALCERVLQSSLFTASERKEQWKLKNQSIYDFFLARWTHKDMASRRSGARCLAVAERADLFESNEVAGFLVGMDLGQKCLIDIAGELCKRGGYAQHNFEQLDQGLPSGPKRLTIIEEAQKGVEGVLEPHLCVGTIMDRLYKTAEPKVGASAEPPKR